MKLSQLTGQSSNRVKLSQLAPAGTNAQGKPNIESSEGFLQRAMKGVAKEYTPQDMAQFKEHPFLSALEFGSRAAIPVGYRAAESVKSEAVNTATQNPFARIGLGIISDPTTYMGGGRIISGAYNKANNFIKGFSGMKDLRAIEKGSVELQGLTRSAANKTYFGRTAEFDRGLESIAKKYPNTSHEITEEVGRLNYLSEFNPNIKLQINKSNIAQRLISSLNTENPSISISTKEFQELRNQLGKGINLQSDKVDWQLRDLLGDFKLKQAEPFPKELGAVREKFAKVKQSYKTIKPKLSENSLTGNIKHGFGNQEVRNRLKNLLPEDLYNRIVAVGKTSENVEEFKRALPWIAGIGGLGAAGYSLGRIFNAFSKYQ